MNIRFYNTFSHSIEQFEPLTPGVVRMYHCGPTVYDFAHIGNFRAFIFADVLRRYLEFVGHRVEQVMNITDVGHMTEDQQVDGAGQDKMELAAERLKAAKKQGRAEVENPDDPYQVAAFFTEAFLEDARLLGMKIADEQAEHMPRATQWIDGMIELIQKLIDTGHAYVGGDGAVYYDVTKYRDYGRLSGNTLDKLQVGAGGRITESEVSVKRHPADFLLWKPDPRHLMKWPSPWGEGYPGWHVECSAMAMGVHHQSTIDIHTGGEDNIFPHHECEIAQSSGATGEPFARFWMHVRFLLVEGEKMSKSKGNFYTVRDLLAKGVDPAVLRYELIKTHYRANMNFTAKGLGDSEKAVQKLRAFAAAAPAQQPGEGAVEMAETDVERRFAEALADDLNVSAALGELFKWINSTPQPSADDVAALRRIDGVLGVLEPAEAEVPAVATEGLTDEQIDAKAQQITEARAARDYATSDRLRDELTEAGIEVQISKQGVKWRRKVTL